MIKKIFSYLILLIIIALLMKACFFRGLYTESSSDIRYAELYNSSYEKDWESKNPEEIDFINSKIIATRRSFFTPKLPYEDGLSLTFHVEGYKVTYTLWLRDESKNTDLSKAIVKGIDGKPYHMSKKDTESIRKFFIDIGIIKK